MADNPEFLRRMTPEQLRAALENWRIGAPSFINIIMQKASPAADPSAISFRQRADGVWVMPDA